MLYLPLRTGFDFWREVDRLNKLETTKELAEVGGLNYVRMRNQRSEGRIPGSVDLLRISKVLGVSPEYLLTGQGEESSSRYARIQDIIDWLMAKSDAELEVFRQYNHVPREKEQSYSSRQEA